MVDFSRSKMTENRLRKWTLTLLLIISVLEQGGAIYFPVRELNVRVPLPTGIARPLPALLKLRALQNQNAEIEYGIETTGNQSLFRIRKNELLFNEDEDPVELYRKIGQEHHLKVWAKSNGSQSDAVIVNLTFSNGEFTCDGLEEQICFDSNGNFRIRRDQKPGPIAYLSSPFPLKVCSNYTVAYQLTTGNEYFRANRMKNSNANSWTLSLAKKLDGTSISSVQFDLKCSVSADRKPAKLYKRELTIEISDDEDHVNEPLERDRQVRLYGSSRMEGLKSMSLVAPDEAEQQKLSLAYPESVEISKFAAFATRVTEPFVRYETDNGGGGRSTRSKQLTRIVDAGIRFLMEANELFGITEAGGIVYVSNPVLLRNFSSIRIQVSWMYPKGFKAFKSILVNITSSDHGRVCGKVIDSKNLKSCSQKTSESDCLRTCGIATGRLNATSTPRTLMGCQWRNNERPEALSVRYRTCSPDLETCPDRYCDPLEKLFPDTCPQDCAVYVFGSANKELFSPGISSAAGVCSCSPEDGKHSCTCDLLDTKKRPATSNEQCGMACLSSIVGGSIVLISGLATFFMVLYHRRLKKRYPHQGPLKEDMININYEEYIHRSAEGLRLPPAAVLHDKPDYYDKKWEFPRYRLTVEQTIGEGEFGKVLKARAEGIGGSEGPTTVAVKTLKENAKESELADLISEYQLLKEVDHPNIIHLLGACTTLEGPLYIIIEYAKHGSLRNYLRRNRHGSSQLHLNEKVSETSYMQSITPKDILTFAWQIAKGMAYLTEMKLVHRDLAARNVLVAEGLICKISDFGLTRDIYEDDTYLKRSKGRVPVKWMALESLSDHVYTTKSDVWSYGIVLWELVTTGASPYPGIAVQNLFHLLKSGYRMERPVNCSLELYQILRSCWNENPSLRPTFKLLVSKLEEMLGEGKDYLDLNPRIIENKIYFSPFLNETDDGDESFLPIGGFREDERNMLRWKFDFSECSCPTGSCNCRSKLRYENENLLRKPKYENETVQDGSYVQPNGEPKPINAVIPEEELGKFAQDNLNRLVNGNLYMESHNKKACEVIKI